VLKENAAAVGKIHASKMFASSMFAVAFFNVIFSVQVTSAV
jgi:hypothetical protein